MHRSVLAKKLHFWKRGRNDGVTNRDTARTTNNLTSETGTPVSSTETILRCDAGTHVDPNLTSEASTQTTNHNEQPENRTDGGGADNKKEEMKSKTAPLEKFLEEKDRHIQKLNATIQQMKEQQRSEIQFIKRKEEIEKSALLRKIRDYERRNHKPKEIQATTDRKRHRGPPTEQKK